MIYYPLPVHLQKGYSMSKFEQGSLAMTEVLCNNVFSLPIHTEMSKETQDYIIQHVLDFF